MDVTGRVAIVTGGGTGIGRAVSLRLASAGAKAVIVNYSRSEAEARETATQIADVGAEGVPVCADVADESAVKAMVDAAVDRFGHLDILVNNAGTTRYLAYSELDAITDQDWQTILWVNLVGAFYCCRRAAPHLRATQGSIVNVASIAAHRASGSAVPYEVSKAGLVQLTRSLAVALAPEVRVNSVSPGQVVTRMPRLAKSVEWAEAVEAQTAQDTPLNNCATPDQIAQAIVSFVESDWTTGQDLIVDGGKSILY